MFSIIGKAKRILITAMAFSVLSGCAGSHAVADVTDYPIEHELEFGGAYI